MELRTYAIMLSLTVGVLASTAYSESRQEPSGQFVTIEGHKIWYRTVGEGEPLLLIPGGPGGSHSYFWPQFDRISNSFKVIYYDAFGRGNSDRAKDLREYSFNHDVDEIEAFRRALNLGKINLYGHSYGGLVAQGYALKYPTSLKRLIIADAVYSAEMWQKGNNDNWNRQVQDQFPEIWAELDSLRSHGTVTTDSVYVAVAGQVPENLLFWYDPSNIDSCSRSAFNLLVYRQIAGPDADVVIGGDIGSLDFRARLSAIDVPTLILAGRFDRLCIPRYSIQFQKFMPQAQFVMFEKSGHRPFIEEPQKHDSVLRAFLSR